MGYHLKDEKIPFTGEEISKQIGKWTKLRHGQPEHRVNYISTKHITSGHCLNL